MNAKLGGRHIALMWLSKVLEVCACIAHGYGTFIFIGDEDLRTGANFHVEVVARTLDLVWAQCSRAGSTPMQHM